MRHKVNLPEGTAGEFRIEKRIVDSWCGHPEPKDEYTILFCPTHEIMQDTTKEYREHAPLWENAKGDVLLAGLGIGMVHQFLIDNEDVTSVTIVEKNQEVIDLVWDHCPKNEKFRLVRADIYDWEPDSTWDVGWFDSWIGECTHEKYFKIIQDKYAKYCEQILFWEEDKHAGNI